MPTNIKFPRVDCLPPAQRKLWPALGEARDDFVLYGGTALALHLGHRQSEDFDFFSAKPFDPEKLHQSMALLKNAAIVDLTDNTLSVLSPDGVSLSFFGGLAPHTLSVFAPKLADNGISVAAVGDVFGLKCSTVQKRATFKDYFDIWAILRHTDYSLADGLSFATAIHGDMFAPHLTLRALCYFNDLDKPLARDKKAVLLSAVQSVDLARLPVVQAKGPIQPARESVADKGV